MIMWRSISQPRSTQITAAPNSLRIRRGLRATSLKSKQDVNLIDSSSKMKQIAESWPVDFQDANVWKQELYSLLEGASERGDASSVRQIEELVEASPLYKESPLHASITISYENCNSIPDVERKFLEFQSKSKPHERIWGALIRTRLREGNVKEAISYFTKMKRAGVPTSHLIYVTCIDRCIEQNQLDVGKEFLIGAIQVDYNWDSKSQAAWTKLISAFIKNGRTNDATDLLNRLRVLNLDFTPQTNNVLLGLLSRTGQINEMLEMFQRLRSNGMPCNTLIWSTVISALATSNRRHETEDMIFQAQIDVIPDISLYNTILKAFGQFNKYEEATLLFEKIVADTTPPQMTWNIFFKILQKQNDPEVLLYYFDMMKESTLPNAHNYSTIIRILCEHGRSKQALKLIEEVQQVLTPVELNETVYGSLIQSLGVLKQPQVAMELFRKMRQSVQPHVHTWNMMLKTCAGRPDLMMEIFDEMRMEKEQEDVHTWTTIINFCPEDRLDDLVDIAAKVVKNPDVHFWRVIAKRTGRDLVMEMQAKENNSR
eukprot:TRINITY_DN21857_c0_g1_i1.p1 TRINITY_DN21857_c0_g1~~TRINITY_DN21857_c0_g1_i1.p1  ORF type:complete len:542 (-),score=132.52 TRINITY_DN21857_c0_g1_i1:94-1719(-)